MDSLLGNTNNQQVSAPILGGNDEVGIMDNIVRFLQKPEVQHMAAAALPVATGQGAYGDNSYSAALRGLGSYNVNKPELDRKNRKERIAELTAMATIKAKEDYGDFLKFKQDNMDRTYDLNVAKLNSDVSSRNKLLGMIFPDKIQQPSAIPNDDLQMTEVATLKQTGNTGTNPDDMMRYGVLTGNKGLVDYGKHLAEQQVNSSAKERRGAQKKQQADRMIGQIDDSINLLEGGAKTGGFGVVLGNIGYGTDTYDLESRLDTIKANLSFDKLQNIRDNSPTGGALGSTSDKELELLANAAANLDIGQSKDVLIKELNNVYGLYSGIMGYDSNSTGSEFNNADNDPLGLR